VAQKISEALEVSIDQLVFGKGQNIETAISDRELISLFKKIQLLSDKKKEMVKEFLSSFVIKTDLQQHLTP